MEGLGSIGSAGIHEVLPREGITHRETLVAPILCKPKLIPLKSLTLSRLEDEQREAQLKFSKEQSTAERLAESVLYESIAAATSDDGPAVQPASYNEAASADFDFSQPASESLASTTKSKSQKSDVLKLDFGKSDAAVDDDVYNFD